MIHRAEVCHSSYSLLRCINERSWKPGEEEEIKSNPGSVDAISNSSLSYMCYMFQRYVVTTYLPSSESRELFRCATLAGLIYCFI